MKAPSLSPAAAGAFFIHHGEKIVFGSIGLLALLMMWWGMSAAQLQVVDRTRTPEAISDLARRASDSIEKSRTVPPGRVPPAPALAPRVDPWRPQQVKMANASARPPVFNPPLYSELTKRTKPEVFPIAGLRAVAGVAVFADPDAQKRAVVQPVDPQPVGQPPATQPPSSTKKPKNKGGEDPAGGPGGSGGLFGVPGGPAGIASDLPPGEQIRPGTIRPFIVVTGLIPAAKQQAEFANRFASVSFRDPRRDSPRWGDYIVERTRVVPGATARWERMKLTNVTKLGVGQNNPGPGAMEATPLTPESLPRGFFLQDDETEIEYAAPLPERVDTGWGEESVHPWFVPKIKDVLAASASASAKREAAKDATLAELVAKPLGFVDKEVRLTGVALDPESQLQKAVGLHKFGVRTADGKISVEPSMIGGTEKLVFATSKELGSKLSFDIEGTKPRPCNLLVRVDMMGKTPVARLLEIELLDEAGEATATRRETSPEPITLEGDGGVVAGGPIVGLQGGAVGPRAENRLFRFVDLGVEPGAEYRYRVRFALRNPNVGLAPQHVANVSVTRGDFLLADYSPETTPVRVPDPTRLVARTMTRDAAKRLKVRGDSVEVMVLARSDENGNYALRSVVTPPGGMANVDPALNRPGDTRHYGQPFNTDRLLLDVRGVQEERIDPKHPVPPEPLELLFLRPDGEFDVVAAADSELLVRKYRSTYFGTGDDSDVPKALQKPPKPPKP
jgi:hypothetical protein